MVQRQHKGVISLRRGSNPMTATKKTEEVKPMDLGKCMIRKCRNCKNESKCFKEYNDYEYSKIENRKSKTSRIQSEKRLEA